MRPTETESTEQINTDERKTRELCTQERNGLRCMRPKDHAHSHAAYTATDTVTWD